MQKLLNESLLQSHIILSNCEDIEYTIYQNNPSRLFWQNRNTFNALMSTMYGMNIVTINWLPREQNSLAYRLPVYTGTAKSRYLYFGLKLYSFGKKK